MSFCWFCHEAAHLPNYRYRKNPKNLDTPTNCCNYPKIGTVSFYYRVTGPKDADGMANCVDPDVGLHCLPKRDCPKTQHLYGSQKRKLVW